MPVELLQSIIYLQRALRDCVIQHQVMKGGGGEG